uniref:S-formylglutathione hydrolase n=2 Tax=Tetraselmis sp. GSL018 TaxID=582737 RepID=A0A061RHM4_9CHLO
MKAEELKSNKMYGGFNKRFRHDSSVCGCPMVFTVFFPPEAAAKKVPVLYYLSGLTCTDENVIQKSGIQKKAAELGVAVVAPDTSPRGLNVEGEDDSYDFGTGAGFYLNATQEKWRNWRMYDYITQELPSVLAGLPGLDTTKAGIMGHSMGGHGALTIFLKNPGKYKSLSALSPICNPMAVPWGEKAFTGYLGPDKEAWKSYDATELVKASSGPFVPTLIDIGTQDDFMHQLSPHTFAAAALQKAMPLTIRMQEGYDHSYFFIQTFIDDHVAHHARLLYA